MPLGDPHAGACSASGGPAPDSRVRTCCNTGYARGRCAAFPIADEGPDAVRFGILRRDAGLTEIRYVRERDHHPHDHGILLLREGEQPEGTLLDRQACAYLRSYLRRQN